MTKHEKTKSVVFVSHSGSDEYLNALCRALPQCEVLVSDWSDKSGTVLAEKVMGDIRRADLVLVVLTKEGATSAWVNQEIGFALGLGKRVLPILHGTEVPALLAGLEWEPFDPASTDASALRAALRVGQFLQEDLVRVFRSYHDYREWWRHIDERLFTIGKCYWATPHDTWAWIMVHDDQDNDIQYRTLIRGDYEFDRLTLKTHYDPREEVVCGVSELSAFEEVAVFGSLSVETVWDPAYWFLYDEFLRTTPSADALFSWYRDHSQEPTTIEVTMILDDARAAAHRRRLDSLFEKYRNTSSAQQDALDR